MNILEEVQVDYLEWKFNRLSEDEVEAAEERIDEMLEDIPDRPEQLKELANWASEFNYVVQTALLGLVKNHMGGFDGDAN